MFCTVTTSKMCRFGVSFVNFEHISHLVLVFSFLIWNNQMFPTVNLAVCIALLNIALYNIAEYFLQCKSN